MANSETFLIGKGFKGDVDQKHPYIVAMLERISGKVPYEVPIFDAKELTKDYLTTIIKASKELTESQITKLNLDIERVNKCLTNKSKGPPKEDPTVKEFHKSIENLLNEWFALNPVLPGTPLNP